MTDTTTELLKSKVIKVGRLLSELKGRETVLLDMRGICSWTDFMVITTGTGEMHMRGLYRNCRQLMGELDFELKNHGDAAADSWLLLDGNQLLVHIMNEESRQFYRLEDLWFQAQRLELPG